MTGPEPRSTTFTCRLGRPLTYSVAGTGPDLVIVNAYGVVAALWEHVVADLSRRHRVLIWNLRGFAETERDLRFTISDHADDLVEILDHAGSERTHVLAYCSGTKVSLVARDRLAGRVRSLAFLGGNFWPIPGYGPMRSRFASNLHKLAQMIRKRPFMAPIVVTMMTGKVVALPMVAENLNMIPEAYRDLVVAPYRSKEAVRTYAELVSAYYEIDTTPLLDHLDVPILVVEGRADTVVDPGLSASVAARLPQAEHAVVEDFDHFCMIVRAASPRRDRRRLRGPRGGRSAAQPGAFGAARAGCGRGGAGVSGRHSAGPAGFGEFPCLPGFDRTRPAVRQRARA